MIKNSNINYCLILIFFFFSCINKHQKPLNIIDIEANLSNYKEVKLSQIINDVTYIPLQSDTSCILGYILSIDFNNENILLTDKNKCLEFSPYGTFIKQIGKRGKGPKEYLYAFKVNSFDEHIFISDHNRILVYDKSGKYITSIKSSFTSPVNFNPNWIPLSDSLLICHLRNVMGDQENKAIVINLQSDTIEVFQNFQKFKREKLSSRSDDSRAQFYYFSNELSYKELFNDTLFRIENFTKMNPAFIFNLGKYGFPNEYRGLPAKEYIESLSAYIWLYKIYETKSLFIMELSLLDHYNLSTQKMYNIKGTIRYGQAPVLAIYEKKTGETYFINPSTIDDKVNPNGIENDFDGGMNFFPDTQINDSTLLMLIQPYELKSFLKLEDVKNYAPKYPEKKKELEKLANRLDENDNPVLMLVKLKE